MVETLTRWSEALAARVFSTFPIFGTEVEWVVLILAAAMLFFTLWLGVPQVRGIHIGLKLLSGKHDDPTAPGSVSQFQALSTALSSTIGLGNIAGVAIAIAMGGPGAALWMFVIGFFAMGLKASEVTLGLMHREVHADGTVHGGPMYTLKNGLASIGFPKSGRRLGAVYAVLACIGGTMPLVQVNQSFSQMAGTVGFTPTPGAGLAYGVVIALLTGVVIIGGVRSIARVTEKLVPMMCVVYLGGVIAVLIANAGAVPGAIATIFESAFNPGAAAGGVLGVFVVGMRRAVFSTEAGVGTAVIAHSAARTRHPASEGMVALLEPMFDTMIVCMATALMIVVTGVYTAGYTDVAMTSAAFESVIGWFPWVLMVAVLLFAFSTILAVGYYFMTAWGYLFGTGQKRDLTAKLFYCLLIPVGAIAGTGAVVDYMDSMFFLLVLPNLVALVLLAPKLRREVNTFLADVKAGRIYRGGEPDDETALPRHD